MSVGVHQVLLGSFAVCWGLSGSVGVCLVHRGLSGFVKVCCVFFLGSLDSVVYFYSHPSTVRDIAHSYKIDYVEQL